MSKIFISLLIGLPISVVALYFAFRNVPFNDLAAYLISIRYGWIIPSAAAVMGTHLLRAARWQTILRSVAPVGYWRTFHILMLGFMLNCIVPGRMGELARPAVLKTKNGVPFSAGLATVAVERVFDLILLLGLFAAATAFVDIDPHVGVDFGGRLLNRETLLAVLAGMVRLSLALIAAIVVLSVPAIRSKMSKLLIKSPRLLVFLGKGTRKKLETALERHAVRMIDNLASGLKLVRTPSTLILCLGYSLLIWLLTGAAYYLFALGCPGVRLGFGEFLTVMVIVCFFIALPSVPGYWGLWEAGGVFAMSLFGVAATDAFGYTLANHAIQVFPIIVVGFVSALVLGIDIRHTAIGSRSASGSAPDPTAH